MTDKTNLFERLVLHLFAVLVLGCTALVASAIPALPQTNQSISSSEAFGLITTVELDVSDEVSDACWTNPSSIKAKLRLLFEQNEIAVAQEELAFFSVPARLVFFSGFGYRIGNGPCVVSARFEVMHNTFSPIGGGDESPKFSVEGRVVSFEKTSIFSNGSNVNQQLKEFAESAASNFVADVLSARRSEKVRLFKNTYPTYGQKNLTLSEWKRILSRMSKDN